MEFWFRGEELVQTVWEHLYQKKRKKKRTFMKVGNHECNPERMNKIIVYLVLTYRKWSEDSKQIKIIHTGKIGKYQVNIIK